MNENVYQLLDGDLSDNDAVDMLRSLIDNHDERTAFLQQLKLQGALSRNEAHNPMSSQEELDMLSRLSAAIGLSGIASGGAAERGGTEHERATEPSAENITTRRRLGPAAWGLITGALLVGGTAGYVCHGVVGVPPAPQQVMSIHSVSPATPPSITPTSAPCNCDSIAMASATAVRDSVQHVNASAPRKSGVRRHVRRVNDDPTGRAAALRLARHPHSH